MRLFEFPPRPKLPPPVYDPKPIYHPSTGLIVSMAASWLIIAAVIFLIIKLV